MADQRNANEGNDKGAEQRADVAGDVQEERSIYDRGDVEEAVASPGDEPARMPESGWRDDVRVDPERQREILRPRNAGNEMRGRGGRDVNWRGEDDQWSALFQDEDSERPDDTQHDEHSIGERSKPGADRDRPVADREVRRSVSREPELDGAVGEEPEGLTSSMLRGAIAGALGALALAFASKNEEVPPATPAGRDDAVLEGVGLSVGFGALLGAIYGAVQTRWEPPALLNALALSGVSYAATASGEARKADAKLAGRTGSGTVSDRLDRGDAHLAFGVTTAAAFDLLR